MSLSNDFDLILGLIEDSKLLAAKEKYDKLMQYISSESVDKNEFFYDLQKKLSQNKDKISQMIERVDRTNGAIREASGDALEGRGDWTLGSELFNVLTYYKLEDDGLLSVRMETDQDDVSIFEQLAVLYEVNLYTEWIPFCSDSKLISQIC